MLIFFERKINKYISINKGGTTSKVEGNPEGGTGNTNPEIKTYKKPKEKLPAI